MNLEFWKKRKVLLTGHTGFKGSWLSLLLHVLGAEVCGYSLSPPTSPSLFEEARIEAITESIQGDVRDLTHLQQTIRDQHPEIVIHMAAQSLVRRSYQDPIETYETNVMGTANILEAIRHSGGIRAAIVVTSDKCYENREWVWGYRESDRVGGYDPYSSSKGCAELVTAAFRQAFFKTAVGASYGTAIASARAGNVIGGGDWAEDRLVPDIIRAVLADRPIVIRNPDSIRPWQHVLDPLAGYMLLAEKLCTGAFEYAESWNFGPREDDAKPVLWITQRLSELWGGSTRWSVDGNEHPHEAHYLKLDCSKATARLGWRPQWDIEQSLCAVVEWYKAYQSGRNTRDVMIRQIQAYLEILKEAAGE